MHDYKVSHLGRAWSEKLKPITSVWINGSNTEHINLDYFKTPAHLWCMNHDCNVQRLNKK